MDSMELERLWQSYWETRDCQYRDLLVEHYWSMMLGTARQFWNRTAQKAQYDDLVSYASEALLRAIEQYDPNKSVHFHGWAVMLMRWAMVDGLREMDHLSKPHRRQFKERGEEPPPAPVSLDRLSETKNYEGFDTDRTDTLASMVGWFEEPIEQKAVRRSDELQQATELVQRLREAADSQGVRGALEALLAHTDADGSVDKAALARAWGYRKATTCGSRMLQLRRALEDGGISVG